MSLVTVVSSVHISVVVSGVAPTSTDIALIGGSVTSVSIKSLGSSSEKLLVLAVSVPFSTPAISVSLLFLTKISSFGNFFNSASFCFF